MIDPNDPPRIIQSIEVQGVAGTCDEPLVAIILPTRKGNRIIVTILELEGPQPWPKDS